MQRYAGRVAIVTGASCGVGAAIAKSLLRYGVSVVGLDLQPDLMKAWELNDATGKLYPRYCDLRKEGSIVSAFKWTSDNVGGVDILINNAGIVFDASPTDGATADWRNMLDVNVLGLSVCTREAVKDMITRGVSDGFIIHICSLEGHGPPSMPALSMYAASKHVVKVLMEGLRKDLEARGSKIRVGEISPGLVDTEVSIRAMQNAPKELKDSTSLQPEDIADAVLYVLSRHPRVQVYDMIVRPTGTVL